MASTYTSNTGIELIATGEQSGTWGNTTNTNLQIIDRLTNGVGAIALSGTTHTLSTTDGTLSDGQHAVLVFGGSPSGTNTVTISPNDQQKVYIVKNNSGESVVLTQGSGGSVTVADGKSAIVYADGAGSGAAVVDVTSTFVLPDANLQAFVDAFTLPTTDGSDGQVLTTNGAGTLSFEDAPGIAGPASSTDNGIALFDGTTGALLQDSASQDGVIHGITIGRGAQSVDTNTVVGAGTGSTFTSGTQFNTVVGSSAGASLTNAERVTFIGHKAGESVTTGDRNTFLGFFAGNLETTGSSNTAVGHLALLSIFGQGGTSNTAIGAGALSNGATENSNVAIGANAMTGSSGFAISGGRNTAVGSAALGDVTSGEQNTGIGNIAGADITTGSNNTLLGTFAGSDITTGSNNTCLGRRAGWTFSPFVITTESNRVVVGDSSVTNAYIEVAWTVTSDARDKTDVVPISHGLDLIDRLNPVTFKWDKRSKYWVMDEDGNVVDKPTPDGTHKEDQPFAGFLAQEVQQAIQEVGFADQIIIDTEQNDNWKLKETALIPVLVKAVQELSARVKELEARV
jgi:hypothetical protein